MRSYLITKLLAIHLAVIGFVMIIVWLSIDTLAAGYFVTLMEKYNISPKPAHAMFISAVHRYLVWAFIGAMALAVALSFVLMRKVLAPLTRMNTTTRKIAAGDFTARVPVNTRDEVGDLARAFNQMAESLEEIENLRRTLMIDVAHELRTPLTNIRGYLEALNDRVLPLSDKTLSLLQDETLRLVQLVEDVLQLARADASHGKLNLERTDLKEIIETTVKSFLRRISEKSLTVNVQIPEKIPMVSLDKHRITRVIRNLMDNAVRYTPEKDDIGICMESDPRMVKIEFTNKSKDLTSQDLPYIFERFYRGEKSRSRQHGGAGIGLAMVKELVEAHQGTAGAEVENGRFRIWFELPQKPLYP
jgi:two-component system, OmpR family, sensor histidine kinase BaeS